MVQSRKFRDCYDDLHGASADAKAWFNDVEAWIRILNDLNICLWIMASLSLPIGVFLDLVCQVFVEFQHMWEQDSEAKEQLRQARALSSETPPARREEEKEKDDFGGSGSGDERDALVDVPAQKISDIDDDENDGGKLVKPLAQERIPTASFVGTGSSIVAVSTLAEEENEAGTGAGTAAAAAPVAGSGLTAAADGGFAE